MSLRLLPVLLFACVLGAPFALAQGPATANPQVTIDLDAAFTTNETIAVLPFTVNFSVAQFACLGTGASFTVALSATADETATGNASDMNVTGEPTATVSPSQLTFQAPAGGGLAQAYSDSAPAVLTVEPRRAGDPSNVSATVVAEVTGVSNCAGGQAADATAEASTDITFESPSFVQPGVDDGQEMPAIGFLSLLAALGVAIYASRRKD